MKRAFLLAILIGILDGAPVTSIAQIANYGPALLARQAVDIRAPYLAQMSQVHYNQQGGSGSPAATKRQVSTTFTRSSVGWLKPWPWANEIAKKVEWDPKAPFGSGFAREEAQRQALTKLFTSCLDLYEQQAKAEGLPTNDVAVTFGRVVALNHELATGKRMPAADEQALRVKIKNDFNRSTSYWTDTDKQAVHETIVITTMLALAGYANATRDNDPRAQAMFRDTARHNVDALTKASLVELSNARSALSQK